MLRIFLFGTAFGFILSRVDATNYDAIVGMFMLTDLQLMGVIGGAIVVGGICLALMRRIPDLKTLDGDPMVIKPKARKPGNIVGGLIFGAGWALSGTCPGTALAQIGEGKMIALFTVAGMLIGTTLYLAVGAKVEAWLAGNRAMSHDSPPISGGEEAA